MVPDDRKSKTQKYLESALKNTSKNFDKKKNLVTPTHLFNIKGEKTGSQKEQFCENRIRDRI